MTTYRIQTRDEECKCKYCGYPLFIGDKVFENAAADPFCSDTCAVVHDSRVGIPYRVETVTNIIAD